MYFLLLITLLCTALAQVPPPIYPKDWAALESLFSAQYLYDYHLDEVNQVYSCSAGTNCHVETHTGLNSVFYDVSGQHRRVGGEGMDALIEDYKAKKSYIVDGSNKCLYWNYLPEDKSHGLQPLSVPMDAEDKGQIVVKKHLCEQYHWTGHANNTEMSIDMFSAIRSDPVPYLERIEYTFYGLACSTGYEYWDAFFPGHQKPELFAVTGIDSCPKSPVAGFSLKPQAPLVKPEAVNHQSLGKAPVIENKVRPPFSPIKKNPPPFVADWYADVKHWDVQLSGTMTEDPVVTYNCAFGKDCLVSTSYAEPTRYYDHTNQRFRDGKMGSADSTVTDYKAKKIYHVDATNTCTRWKATTEESLPIFTPVDSKFKDVGPAKISGHDCEHYSYKDGLKSTLYDWYIDISGATAIPIFSNTTTYFASEKLPTGWDAVLYTQFYPAAPSADVFNIKKTESCPQSPF